MVQVPLAHGAEIVAAQIAAAQILARGPLFGQGATILNRAHRYRHDAVSSRKEAGVRQISPPAPPVRPEGVHCKSTP